MTKNIMYLLGSLMVLVVSGKGFCDVSESEKINSISHMVRSAAQLVETKGETAFDEFGKQGSEWFHDETYLFVIDKEANVIVNPAQPELQGTNVMALKDENGKSFVRDYIDLVSQSPDGEAWGHYVWHRPPENSLAWKAAFIKSVKAPSGKDYLIGSGLYNAVPDKPFVVDTVENAIRLIEKKGHDAFAVFNDKTSQYQYQEVYIFIIDENGLQLAHGMKPELIGTNIIDFKDTNGKFFVKEMISLLKTQESGWVEYTWPKPGETSPSKKASYVKRTELDGKMIVVGAGIYLD